MRRSAIADYSAVSFVTPAFAYAEAGSGSIHGLEAFHLRPHDRNGNNLAYEPQNSPIDMSGASLKGRAVSKIRIGFPWLPFRESDVFQPGAHDDAKF